MKAEIRYGKHNVSFYRTNPVRGLLAGRVSIDVFGDNFLPAYTQGDNRDVVATDTMKNFVYAMALDYPGDTHEGFAAFLGRRFLKTYPQMQWLRIQVQEIPFVQHSAKLLSPTDDDYGWVELDIERDGMRALRCGRRNLRLVKLTGSAFKNFARDAYTTLPEVSDRPLFIYLDVYWRYGRADDGVADGPTHIPSEVVRDSVIATFDDFVSMSIQHLVHEMAIRLLDRFPAISELSFEAQNRLWDTSKVSETDPVSKVFSDPKPAHGFIGLTLRRDA
ncbi:MAG: urate oxidase [Chloroflexi bacterium]|nr:MAG: urate oxidase [Chloroflexota bacterium]